MGEISEVTETKFVSNEINTRCAFVMILSVPPPPPIL